ncbi:tPR domain protein [Prevotella sp. CAG:1185]|nr:tPR domain protein [Prevotella sp. CAG:1185]
MTNASSELSMAWDIIENTGANLFLTGKAGTGKTTFLKDVREKSTKRLIVLAPTGIAAINAGGVTIHSFFQLPLSPYVPGATFGGEEQKYYRFSKVKRNIIRTMDLLVIDEISMVRADLLDAIDSVMRRYREHDKPFGGVQLLLIGDLQQLAPVIKDDEWSMLSKFYSTPYFFSSNVLNAANYHTVELKTVYRQQDEDFISILNQIRENRATDETLAILNKRYIPDFVPDKKSDYIRLTTHNYPAQMINDKELSLLPSKEYVFKAEVEGDFPETSYPADDNLVLKQGAQIMFIKNDPEKRFFNGMIGEVVSLDDTHIIVRGKNGGESFGLEKSEWTNSKYTLDDVTKEIKETVEGVFRQYPLRLAWAITIHKSQGLTFEHAIIDVSHSFAHGQTYVALSRCRTLQGIVLSEPLQRDAIVCDRTLDTYINTIEERVPTVETLAELHNSYIIQLLDELFNFTVMRSSFNMVLRTLDEHLYKKYPKLLEEYKQAALLFDDIIDVSHRFRAQYLRMLNNVQDISNDEIQGRIHKAAAYFVRAIKPFTLLCNKTKVEIENKAVKKQFDDRYGVFYKDFILKEKLLMHAEDTETKFSISDYLHVKSNILLSLDDNSTKLNRIKKPKAVKEPRVPTYKVSFDMFSSGKSIEQIAKERGLVYGTIFGHIARYVEKGDIDISKIIPEQHLVMLKSYMSSHTENTSVGDIYSELGPTVDYNEIRLYLKMYSH